MNKQAEIVKLSGHELAGTDGRNEAIAAWADATTDASSRRRKDLQRDKSRAVLDFFAFSGKSPEQVRPRDVKAWQAELERRELSPATVYAMISRVSSFYTWVRKIDGLGGALPINPVNGARPKAPKAYQSESIKALADDELDELIRFVKAKADSGSTVGKAGLRALAALCPDRPAPAGGDWTALGRHPKERDHDRELSGEGRQVRGP